MFVSAELVTGLKMAWDQEFSSGLMLLTIMIVRLFQFRSAVTVAPKLVVRFDILQDPCTWRSPWRPARAFGACGSYAFHGTGDLDSPHRVFEFCKPVEVSKDVVVSFSSSSGSFERAE